MGKRQEQECAYYREQLKKDQERLADLEARGDEACSTYDLSYGYNAEFNIQLKKNHIAYDLKQLEKCPKPLIEMTPASPVTLTTPAEPAQPKKPAPEQPMTQGRLF